MWLLFVRVRSCCVTQAGLNSIIFLPQPPKCTVDLKQALGYGLEHLYLDKKVPKAGGAHLPR